MRTRITTCLLVLCFIGQAAYAQGTYDSSIDASFEKYKKAYLEVDRAVLVDMAHPNIIEVGGGPYYYIETLNDEYNMYSRQGLSLKGLIIKKASRVVKTIADLQAMIPYIKSFDTDSGPITEEGFFLITSQDDGKSWYFTDMKKYDAESIKLFIPNYNERLNIYINSVSH